MNIRRIAGLFLLPALLILQVSCSKPAKKDLGNKNYDAYNGTVGSTAAPADPNALNVTPVAGSGNTPTQQTTTTAPGMNPPHGQPNHRCDIPVGAPLNSPPGKTANSGHATQVQQVPSTQQSVTPANTTVTAPGMNPPHGQPNHRCDIPVGAPLNSAPAQKSTITPSNTRNTPAPESTKPADSAK